MTDYFLTMTIYLTLALSFIGLLFLWSAKVKGGIKPALKHWKEKRLFRDMTGLIWIPPVLFGLISIANHAKADELVFFEYLQINAGLEYQIYDKPFTTCEQSSDQLDQVGSNLGAVLNIATLKSNAYQLSVNSVYTHHSCAVETDYNVYDAVGLQVAWRLNLRELWYNAQKLAE